MVEVQLHYFCFPAANTIRCTVFSRPRISIISGTEGPSCSPLNPARSAFISFSNARWFRSANVLIKRLSSALLNSGTSVSVERFFANSAKMSKREKELYEILIRWEILKFYCSYQCQRSSPS